MTSALILTFHGISGLSTPTLSPEHEFAQKYTVQRNNFEQILDLIPPDACCTVSELSDKTKGHWIALTFDDGLLSDFTEAFPLLLQRRLKGTFYVTAYNIGKEGYCKIEHLQRMALSNMEIGSHGLTHRYLTTMPRDEVIKEINISKIIIEQGIGKKVKTFAAVGGHYKKWMYKAAFDAGYKSFATMIPGKNRLHDACAVLHRNHIQQHHDLRYASRLIATSQPLLLCNIMRYYSLQAPKSILGMCRYDRLKKILLAAISSLSHNQPTKSGME